MTDRELVTVFWATCLLVVFIPLVVGLWRLIRYGIEKQNREVDELLDSLESLAREDERLAIEAALASDWNKVVADAHSSLAAPTDSGLAHAADSTEPPVRETI